ncbi:MAG: adenine-specific methyltransferase EcoRI family protein [Candidatus Hydrogenedentes bacterium]|nr:adenine-specific methyltransferase EcoRI family protein [Candidatus Hydrogenedentota bacterium]
MDKKTKKKTLNRSLHAAKASKQDEFYTQLSDIEKELKHYKHHFKGKTVLCNCDDPKASNFFHYFSRKFDDLKLKKLITTCYQSLDPELFSKNDSKKGVYLEYEGERTPGGRVPTPGRIGIHHFKGDGDFRSDECIELLKQADIVVTNPPFSLFREYVTQLVEHKKNFIVLANQNSLSTKDVFGLVRDDKLWLGYNNGDMAFRVPDHYEARATRFWVDESGNKWRSFGTMCWLTNLDIAKRHEDLILYKTYDPEVYPTYDNFDAIDVSKVDSIPVDYFGTMGVPGGFLTKHNPDQFEIVGITKTWCGMASKKYPKQIQVDADGTKSEVTKLNDGAALKWPTRPTGKTYYIVDGEYFTQTYPRLLIRRKEHQ